MSRSWGHGRSVALLAAIVFGLTLAPVVQSHAGSFKRFEQGGDPEISVKQDSDPASPFIGTSCPRTDLLWTKVEAFHEDEPDETYDGTRVTMKVADLSADCPLETEGQTEFYYYAIEFKPQNWDWFHAWVEVIDGVSRQQFRWFDGGSMGGTACYDCGAEADMANGTVSFEIPLWLATPPYEEAYVHTSMDSCLHSATSLCFTGPPPSVAKHGDIMPDVGTYCFFCQPGGH